MTMIRAGRDLHINATFVASLEWDHRHYMNGSDSVLIITMHDGTVHRVKHQPWYLDSPDCYKLEREILAAIEKGESQ